MKDQFKMSDAELTDTAPAIVAHHFRTMTAHDYAMWKIEATEETMRRKVNQAGFKDHEETKHVLHEAAYRETAIKKMRRQVEQNVL